MLKKNQKAEVLIESTTPEGFGICRLEGRAVFVSSALSGERWEILILKVTNTAVWAKGLKLIAASPKRIDPDCENPCGGCTLRFALYEEELRIKQLHIDDCLQRIGGLDCKTAVIHPSPFNMQYRNKAVFAVGEVEGKVAFGFYRPRSHQLVPIQNCRLQSKSCLQAAQAVVSFMNEHGIRAYDERTGKGTVRHIFWRESRMGDRTLCIVAARGFGPLTETLTVYLRAACPDLTGIVLNMNKTQGNSVLAGDFYTLWGEPTVRESLCGNIFSIAPQAFLQINPPQAEALYEKALQYATEPLTGQRTPGKELALDLYCGAGTISLCLAKSFKRVIGAELVPEAIENAKQNAARNQVGHVEFICANAADAALALKNQELQPDVVVVDPPRKGLEESVIHDIVRMNPVRIVYISCNPSTLARDLKQFKEEGYDLFQAEAYDMFPRTSHIETVCLLSQLKNFHFSAV